MPTDNGTTRDGLHVNTQKHDSLMSHKTQRVVKKRAHSRFFNIMSTHRAAILDFKLRVPQSFWAEIQALAEGSGDVWVVIRGVCCPLWSGFLTSCLWSEEEVWWCGDLIRIRFWLCGLISFGDEKPIRVLNRWKCLPDRGVEPHWAPRCRQRHVPSVRVWKRDVNKDGRRASSVLTLLMSLATRVCCGLWRLIFSRCWRLLTPSWLRLSVMKLRPFRRPQSALSC